MELKVWVDSVQRVVCGVTPATTCQDVIIALAQAMGRTGRFNLIEQWRGAERPLGATDSPMEVLQKWGEYAHEVTFALCESAAKKKKKSKDPSTESEAAAARAHRTTTVRGGGKGAPNAGRGSSAVRKSLSFSGASFAAGGLSTCQVQVAYKKVVPSVESIGERDHEMDFENSLKDPPPPPPSSAARPPPMPQHSVLGESKQKGGMQNASDRSAASGLQQPAAAPRPSVLLRLASSAAAASYPKAGSPSPADSSARLIERDGDVVDARAASGGEERQTTAALVSGNESRYADPTKSSEEYERLLNVVSLQGDTLALQQSRLALLDKEIASRRQKEQGKADEVTALQHLLCELEATCKHLDRELERSASPPPQAQGGGGSGSGGYADRRELDVSATSATAEIEALRREAERLRVAAAAERSRAAECERSLAEHELLVGQLGAHAATCRQQLAQLSAAAEDRDADAECERLRRLCSEERLALERLEAECERAADDVQKAEATVVAKRRAVDTVELELNARGGGRGSAGPHATAGAAVAAAAAAAGRSREDGSGKAVTVESTAAGASPAAPAPGGRMSAAKGARGSVYC